MRTRWSASAAISRGSPQASLPNNHAVRPAQQVARLVEGDLAVTVGGEHAQAGRLRGGDSRGHVGLDREGQVEQAAHARPDGLGVVGVDAAARQHDAVGAGRIGRADHRAGVAGVADVGADRDQARSDGPRPGSDRACGRRGSGRRPRRRPASPSRRGRRGRGRRPAPRPRHAASAAPRRAAYRLVASTVANTSTTQPSTSRAASTAFGPSARKSRRSERTERRLSFRASLTRALPAVSGG